jgi:hypothetical protein
MSGGKNLVSSTPGTRYGTQPLKCCRSMAGKGALDCDGVVSSLAGGAGIFQ